MRNEARRPFYDEFAWAFDLLITQDIASQCDFIVASLACRGVHSGAHLLDAGCGVGGHSRELARRGFVVTGIDLSPGLIAEAEARAIKARLSITFIVGDILSLAASPRFDAILCRGVLNDLLDEASRSEVFRCFARALAPGGALVLDVREWERTAERKRREPVFEKEVETERGKLTFRSLTRLDVDARRLLVSERHTLSRGGVETVSDYDFIMQCWTREELSRNLARAGFERAEYFGAYNSAAPAGSSDRLVCVASRPA